MIRPRIKQALLVAGALAVSGGAASFATDPAGDSGDPQPPRQQPVQQVEGDQVAYYGVLRRERAPLDQMPDRARTFVDKTVTGDNGASPGLARLARTTPAGDAVFVIPARGWICLYVMEGELGAGGCSRTGAALQGHALLAESPAPGITRVTGLVPDGATEVRLHGKDGTVERTVPEGNVYVFETARLPKQVEFGDAVVPVTSPLDLPS